MATITAIINIEDAKEVAIRRDMAAALNYPETITDGEGKQIPNPVSKAKYVQQIYNEVFREWFRNTLKAYRQNEASKAVADETVTLPIIP
jgi:hypothetical protein